jgi:hypothetical protein
MSYSDPVPNMPEKSDSSFDAPIDLETLAVQQGVAPATNPAALLGNFWPEEENMDDFLQALRDWRQDNGKLEAR